MTRRSALLTGAAAPLAAAPGKMQLCMHQTTSLAAGYRKSLEGYAKAGIRFVEVIPAHVDEFVAKEGMPAAKRLLSDLGIKAVSSGGVRGLAEPSPERPKFLEDLKKRAAITAELGVDRMIWPCATNAKFTPDDYKRGVDNLREAGDIAKQFNVTGMPEFMRGSTFIGTLRTALKVIREVNHPNVKPIFDFYHFWAGLSKLGDMELIHSGEIHHVHFQDVPDLPQELLDNNSRAIPGDGWSPIVSILQNLKKKGYAGPLSVELFYPHLQKGDPYEVASEIKRKAEPLMRKAGVL